MSQHILVYDDKSPNTDTDQEVGQHWTTLGQHWANAGPTLSQQWANNGPTLSQYWGSAGATLGKYWTTLGQHWANTRAALGLHWANNEPTLGHTRQRWANTRPTLNRRWSALTMVSIGPTLDQLWANTGFALGQHWVNTGPILVNTVPTLVQHRTNTKELSNQGRSVNLPGLLTHREIQFELLNYYYWDFYNKIENSNCWSNCEWKI